MRNRAAASPEGAHSAAIYCRISQDRDGDAEGVARQEADCRALAARLGYEVDEAHVFIENDIGASTRSTKKRPLYAQMLDAARSGEIQAIIAYSNSRLTRRVREYLDLIDLVEKHGTQIHTLASGDVNLSTADGRGIALTLAAWDAAEAERLGERVARAKVQATADGRFKGGRRPYGFEPDGLTIRESEAAVIRWITSSLLAGRSVRALVNELNEKGTPSTAGGKWAQNSLRGVALRARNAGLISTGQRSHGDFKIHGKALWKPIVAEAEWRAVEDLLTARGRRTNEGKNSAAWLGSGIYRCGVTVEGTECGAVLRGTTKRPGPSDPNAAERRMYRCSAQAHMMVTAEHVDKVVTEEVVRLVSDPRIAAAIAPSGIDLAPDRAEVAVLQQRLARTERDYDDDLIDARRYAAKAAKIEAEIAAVTRRMAKALQRATANPILAAADPGKAFIDAPLDVQRGVLATVMRVTILRNPHRGRVFDKNRVRMESVGGEASAAA